MNQILWTKVDTNLIIDKSINPKKQRRYFFKVQFVLSVALFFVLTNVTYFDTLLFDIVNFNS